MHFPKSENTFCICIKRKRMLTRRYLVTETEIEYLMLTLSHAYFISWPIIFLWWWPMFRWHHVLEFSRRHQPVNDHVLSMGKYSITSVQINEIRMTTAGYNLLPQSAGMIDGIECLNASRRVSDQLFTPPRSVMWPTTCKRQDATQRIMEQGKSEGFDSCDRPTNLTQIGFKSLTFQPNDLEFW